MLKVKRSIDMEHSLCLPVRFCFYQLVLCSFRYTAKGCSIYHFCIIIKDFFISFSTVIIVQDFWNCNFLCVICIQADFLCYFQLFWVRVSRKFNSLFIPYISTAKPISLARGYIEVKISKHDIW